MEKLIQPVKEVYSKFVFDKQTPSYVEIYTKNETEAVIVYSKVYVSIVCVCKINQNPYFCDINKLFVKAKLTPASTLQVTNENNKSGMENLN